MTTAIQFLRSNVPGLRPNPLTLSDGMPMINYNPNDPGLYFRSNDNTLLKIGPTQISANPPNYNGPGFDQLCKGEAWLDTSAPDAMTPRAVLKIWSGSAWVAAGGAILQEEQPQKANHVFVGPYSGPDLVPTFRLLGNDDLPDDIDYRKFAGGELPGGLLIGGGDPGWEVRNLTMGPGLTQTVGPNSITLEVTAGDIAASGQPGIDFPEGSGQIQFNYNGKFTGDNRFKWAHINNPAEPDALLAHASTELGFDPASDTHTIKGDTSLSGDLTLTNVYSIVAGGDLTIGHNTSLGIASTDFLHVNATSTFNADVTLSNLNSMVIGGDLQVNHNNTLGTGGTDVQTLNGTTLITGDATIGSGCLSTTLTVNSPTVHNCLVTFEEGFESNGDAELKGNVSLGSTCADAILIKGTQYNQCDVLFGENVPNANAELIKFHADTGLGEFKNSVQIGDDLQVGDNLPTGWNFAVEGSSGDVTSQGTVTAAYFVGDGSQLYNLAVPNSMLFHGDIDATVGPVPADPLAGDFYLHTGPSTTVLASWPNIGGSPIQQDQFVYFYDDGVGSGKWALGSVQNQQGFVTINSNQDINGTKTFTVHQQFDSTVTIEDHAQLNNTLTVQRATQLNDTLTVASGKATVLGGTLTVQQATQLNDTLTVAADKATVLGGTLTVADGKNTVLGNDLTVKQNSLFGSGCSNTFVVNAASSFKCGLEIGDSSNHCSTGDFNVYSPTNIHCPTTVFNTFTVSGNFATTLGGSLTVEDSRPTVLGGTLQAKGNTTINGTLTVSDNKASVLGGTLQAKGNTAINGTFTVSDNKASVLGGTLQVKQATSLNSSLTVTGGTQFNNTLTVADNQATVLGGTLEVKQNVKVGADKFNITAADGNTAIAGTLTVTGATQLNNTLTVADNRATVLGGTTQIKQAATLNNTLSVTGATTLNNTLAVSGASTMNSTMLVKGATTLFESKNCAATALTVNGQSTFSCLATFSEGIVIPGDHDLNVGGDLSVDGNIELGSNCVAHTLAVTAVATFNCATSFKSTVGVTGATTLSSTLAVTGATTLNSSLLVKSTTTLQNTLAVTGATTLSSTLAVTGATTLNSTLVTKGTATLQSTLAVTGATTLSNTLAVTGATTLNSTLLAKGATTLQSTLAVSGNTTLSGTLVVTGATTLNSTLAIKNTTTLRHTNPEANNTYNLGTSALKWQNAYATTFHGALSGNASTATTLQTARTINGTNFNGSANIVTSYWGTARNLTVGNTAKSVNGSANISWSHAEIGINNVGINFNAGNGLAQSGANATTNQSAATTKTFSVKAADSTITVDSSGVKVNTTALPPANNGQINVNAGNGLVASGSNATANQSGNTTRTLAVKHKDSSIGSDGNGIIITISALPTR